MKTGYSGECELRRHTLRGGVNEEDEPGAEPEKDVSSASSVA